MDLVRVKEKLGLRRVQGGTTVDRAGVLIKGGLQVTMLKSRDRKHPSMGG